MPTGPPPGEPKVEMLPQLCKEEGAITGTFTVIVTLRWVGKYA